jgi:hypothetical protein
MSWKDLFIINEDETKKEATAPATSEPVKFPSATSSVTMAPTGFGSPSVGTPMTPPSMGIPLESNPMCQPHMEKIIQMYEAGFDGLNMEGYDFFEFYKAVLSAGADNPAVYPMAFTMAQSMDKKITRDLLITQSDFYVQEISKVHTKYVEGGSGKKNELLSRKENEREQLGTEVQNLRMQIEALTNQMNNAQNNLIQIDNKYANDLTEVECKLMANDVAKNNLLASIDKVKQGLINNVK